MRSKKVIGFTALWLGLCGGLCFVLWPGPASPGQSGGPAASAPTHEPAAPRKVLALDELYAEGLAKTRPGGGAAGSGTPASETSLDGMLAELLDADPRLRQFYSLRRKALRTSAEQQDYLRMISDESLIADARADLLAAFSSREVDQREELKRLQRIQYLNSALAWADNPERAAAVDAVTDVLLAEIPTGASRSVKGSALGDKFDLFQLLMLSDPDRAAHLLAKTRGTPLENVFQLAWATGSSPRKSLTH
jgi:hypothetical protein